MTITIRDLSEDDLEFLVEIRNECRNFLHDASEFSLEECKIWFKKTKPQFYIIENEGTKIGYFRTSNWQQDSCWVGGDLHKDYRGKGLMKNAYVNLFHYLKNMQIRKVFLSVLSFNETAFFLYKKLGFEILTTTKIYQNGTNRLTDSIQMVKVL